MSGFFHRFLLWFIIFKSNKSKSSGISSFWIFFYICKYNISKLWKMLLQLFFSGLPRNTEKMGKSVDPWRESYLRTAKSEGFCVALFGGCDWANSTSGFWSRIVLFSRLAALSLLKKFLAHGTPDRETVTIVNKPVNNIESDIGWPSHGTIGWQE